MHAGLQQNYFELFGLPATFHLDGADLAARYRALQQRIHPDRFAQASDADRRLALQLTARANEAFQTLKDPVRRGRYLLALRGVATDEETDTVMDPQFLLTQMELREQLAQVRDARDTAGLLRLAGEVEAEIARRVSALGAQLADSDSNETRTRARALVRELQFLQKALAEIHILEEAV